MAHVNEGQGALDVRASGINESMKLAAVEALAQLARQDVPDDVLRAYGRQRMRFGKNYIIPKPFDTRVLYWVAPAVARAAIESGVARDQIDIEEYRDRLFRTISPARRVLWNITETAKSGPRRIVFSAHPWVPEAAIGTDSHTGGLAVRH